MPVAGPGRLAAPLLAEFDLATTSAGERPGFTHRNEIAGRPPFRRNRVAAGSSPPVISAV